MIPRFVKATTLIFLIFLIILPDALAKGHLVIIGGGSRPDDVMKAVIDLLDEPGSKLMIIPMASSEPVETAEYQKGQFQNLGHSNTDYIYCNREKADSDSILALMDNVRGIFFSGGAQSRLTQILLGTRLLSRIRKIYESGGVIAGTSAGAAVMSQIMITGDEIKYGEDDRVFASIEKNNIVTIEGFGFIKSAVIDQHFISRKRHNRLISIILENPQLIGIGIDESTAIIVEPDSDIEVIGERQVIIYDASNSNDITTDDKDLFNASGLVMHILNAGKKYNINSRSLIN